MINLIKKFCAFAIILVSVCSCTKEEAIKGVIWSSELVYSFTANSDLYNKIETLDIDADQQEVTLSIKSLLVSGFPMPNNLYLTVDVWDEEKDKWTSNPSDNVTDIWGDFYHVYTEAKDGMPQIRVDVTANETKSERRIKIYASSDPIDHILPYGNIQIVQAPANINYKCSII